MAVKSDKLGPGWLRFGEPGAELEFGVGMKSVAVEFDAEEGDVIAVLSGDEVSDGDAESFKLTGELLQSYDRSSLLVWSHVNAGARVPFEFRPDRDKALIVRGEVTVKRLTIGGDVKTRNTSDLEWPGVGMPTLWDGTDPVPVQITTYTGDGAPATGPAGLDPTDPNWN